ncbi:MAG: KH domain-containing protein [Thermotogaceae bacterium]|nr:KH domain-containing protein [Thermotogaceae bacterium]
MKKVLEYILKGIVKYPEDVVVIEFEEDEGKVIEIVVNKDDVGQVIGKDGRTIKSLKALLSALTEDEHFTLKVIR